MRRWWRNTYCWFGCDYQWVDYPLLKLRDRVCRRCNSRKLGSLDFTGGITPKGDE